MEMKLKNHANTTTIVKNDDVFVKRTEKPGETGFRSTR